ncbi:hypothetical protein SY83_16515 [Paenibacillus swuensis]|uniref:Uncharacterized protein n=1 Tax=Paenibacillus swuensis TaxID=1178515 RepID=A0A172TKQ4_9BACL|nr:YpdA family putative bacillithiol disulfide reductase [Paenibacillus swuensis]ANE47621.1 hypothetical protein SY83_16515 [Paenibacillus swuensis]
MEDIIVIGAGPCGLSAAIELQQAGFRPLIIEKHNIVHSIYLYPTYLQFFSTPELLEIGNIPFTTPHEKPNRQEALAYYRNAAKLHQLRIQSYTEAVAVRKNDTIFEVETIRQNGNKETLKASHVVIATGYFDHPNRLGIPGEDLPNVTHYYREAHPYANMRTLIIGGNNSAVDAAMDLLRVGAEVTIVYRGEQLSAGIKPWVKPLFESMIEKGRIRMLLGSRVVNIEEQTVTVDIGNSQTEVIASDFVLALTGFRPDRTLLATAGIHLTEGQTVPDYNRDTMETSVPGLYIAGVIASGSNANEIFIESGRHHGKYIAQHLITNP